MACLASKNAGHGKSQQTDVRNSPPYVQGGRLCRLVSSHPGRAFAAETGTMLCRLMTPWQVLVLRLAFKTGAPTLAGSPC